MRIIIIICSILIFVTVFGQAEKNIAIVHKQEKYYLTKTCYDIISWDEVVLKDRLISNKINPVIRKAVNSYKLTKSDAPLLCDKSRKFSRITKFEVVFAKYDLLSYSLYSDTYYTGILHDFHEFSTLNFNLVTGKQITFNDLIDSTQLSNVDSLIIRKLTLERSYNGVDSSELKTQLENKQFNLEDTGIEILYWYGYYPMGMLLTHEELKPFVNKKGPLKKFYANPNQ